MIVSVMTTRRHVPIQGFPISGLPRSVLRMSVTSIVTSNTQPQSTAFTTCSLRTVRTDVVSCGLVFPFTCLEKRFDWGLPKLSELRKRESTNYQLFFFFFFLGFKASLTRFQQWSVHIKINTLHKLDGLQKYFQNKHIFWTTFVEKFNEIPRNLKKSTNIKFLKVLFKCV